MSRSRQVAKVLPLSPPTAQNGVQLARIVGIEDDTLLVEVPGHGVAPARLATPIERARAQAAVQAQSSAVIALEAGNPQHPIVLGLLEPGFSTDSRPEFSRPTAEARVDGQRVVITGKEEVVLACGEATITLRANGKLVIRGAYVETRSSGTNRIKGGSVQIN